VLNFVSACSAQGKSVIFIDHNIFHVAPVADRIVVLDRGRIAGQFDKGSLTLEQLIDKLYLVAQTGSLNSSPNENPELDRL
jgi:simple sugar transport system ATP-binding protein